MKIIASQTRGVIWINGQEPRVEYALPAEIVKRIAKLERLANARKLPKGAAAKRELDRLTKAAEVAEEITSDVQGRALRFERDMQRREFPNAEIALSDHECAKSVTGRCVYDANDDSCHDFCLVCGDPEERK